MDTQGRDQLRVEVCEQHPTHPHSLHLSPLCPQQVQVQVYPQQVPLKLGGQSFHHQQLLLPRSKVAKLCPPPPLYPPYHLPLTGRDLPLCQHQDSLSQHFPTNQRASQEMQAELEIRMDGGETEEEERALICDNFLPL